MEDSVVALSDRRALAYTDIGDPLGLPLLFFHGAPMSRLHLTYLDAPFAARNLRVISPDRPGYGGSSPQPGRLLLDWPADVIALADALGLGRFMVAGHSSGGPYAVVSAATLPGRVSAMIVVAGVTDMGWHSAWDGFSAKESTLMGMSDEPSAIAWSVEKFGVDGSGFGAGSDFEFAKPDLALFKDRTAGAAIRAAVDEAFRQGIAGYAQDAFVQGRPWQFDPAAIVAPARILHGALDRAVPLAHSRHTAERIGGSNLQILPGHGHMTILSELPIIAAELRDS